MSETLNQSDYTTVWSDNFTQDSSLNTNIFPNHWGNGNEFSFNGGLTITSDGNAAGFLTPDGGAGDSYGYGLYQATLSVPSNNQQPGIAVLMWPASNQWPGPEIDLAEQLNGQAYMTVHWQGGDGTDNYQSYFMPSVDLTQPTNVAMAWDANSLTYYVNGQAIVQYASGGSVPIPVDAAHGGQNEALGAQVNSTWGSQLTLYGMSYSQYTGSGGGGAVASISPQTNGGGGATFNTTGDASSGSGQTLYAAPGTDILQGGSGVDTFYVDPTSGDGWAEVNNFHSGDVVNFLNYDQGKSTITWTTATDANGQTGATAQISLNGDGHVDSSVTFAGVSAATAQNWQQGNWHTDSGTPYLSIWQT